MLKDGFLGYQTSFMLDFVVCALVLIIPLLVFSIRSVKFRKNYQLHRRFQIVLSIMLFAAVAAFEIDLHVIQDGWESVVAKSAANDDVLKERIAAARPWLYFHLIFAVSTPIIWAITFGFALARFEATPAPGSHSKAHKILGWTSAIDVILTAVTGTLFYYAAFVNT